MSMKVDLKTGDLNKRSSLPSVDDAKIQSYGKTILIVIESIIFIIAVVLSCLAYKRLDKDTTEFFSLLIYGIIPITIILMFVAVVFLGRHTSINGKYRVKILHLHWRISYSLQSGAVDNLNVQYEKMTDAAGRPCRWVKSYKDRYKKLLLLETSGTDAPVKPPEIPKGYTLKDFEVQEHYWLTGVYKGRQIELAILKEVYEKQYDLLQRSIIYPIVYDDTVIVGLEEEKK